MFVGKLEHQEHLPVMYSQTCHLRFPLKNM